MSVLQKGVLTVIGVTAFASVLILLTGKNATAEADSQSTHSVKTTNIVSESFATSVPKVIPNTSHNPVKSKNTLGDDGAQQESLNKPLLPALPLAPPPIGPFQVARPNGYRLPDKISSSSVTPSIKLLESTAIALPDQNMKPTVAPMIKTMNLQAPQPPKGIGSQPLKPELQIKTVNIPVNRLVKPQAPVQKIPEMFAAPPAAPIMQRYMYVPVPAQMYQQVPKIPMTGTHTATSAVENGQNKSGTIHNNTQQPNK